MLTNWHITETDERTVVRLSDALRIHRVTARTLVNRGIESEDEAKRFLNPSLSDLPDPSTLPDIDKACDRIVTAIERGERIAIFGDYDVDGITGSALLHLFLKDVGVQTTVRLPKRSDDGYGLGMRIVEEIHGAGAKVLITVDNGTRSVDEIEYAKTLGLDVVVTDHHDAKGELPRAAALVNPQLADGHDSIRHLSGCGVAFMLAVALRQRLRAAGMLANPEPNLRQHLDLVALGTIADIVPLIGVNRILAKFGLEEISNSAKPGVRALFDISGVKMKGISTGIVAFRLAPRINAAGRLGDPHDAFELLTSTDALRVQDLARNLDKQNRERQAIEEKILRKTLKEIESSGGASESRAIVMSSAGWHVGVIGIVASKIVETTGSPAVVITEDAEPARGSARSVKGLNIVDALSKCSDLLVRFGGHAMAAGLSIERSKIAVFKERFVDACAESMSGAATGRISIDATVDPEDIDDTLIDELGMCQPFGVGNPEPVFALSNVKIVDRRIVGGDHLKLRIAAGEMYFDAIGFGMGARVPQGITEAALAFFPQFNEYNGVTKIQLKVKDIQTGP